MLVGMVLSQIIYTRRQSIPWVRGGAWTCRTTWRASPWKQEQESKESAHLKWMQWC